MTNARKLYKDIRPMGIALLFSVIAAALSACGAPASTQATSCENLSSVKLEHAVISSARAVSAGRFFQWRTAFIGLPFFNVPASCRIKVVSEPTSDSHINIEIWLPLNQWNGKFQGLGNGGFAGAIDGMGLALAVEKGYAAASTDAGHEASDRDGSWALGHIEKIRDYGYRAIHETVIIAKVLIAAFYGNAPKFSYFDGGSNGGREGLMEAQRFPEDYDGIVAGCPALDPSSTLPVWAWIQQSVSETPGAHISPGKLKTIAAAVNQSCDAQDGVRDGVIDDPRACRFDPAVLECRGPDADSCLTSPQVKALRDIYSGPPAKSPTEFRRGFEPGGELGGSGWQDWLSGSRPAKSVQYGYALEFYRYLVYDDPKWNLERFDYARDQDVMRVRLGTILDATDPDLSAFQARGGKLIMYHGWNDPALPPRMTIAYYQQIQERMGHEVADSFVRLYMVPGMQHCFGGPGPNTFGQLPPGGTADPHYNVSAALERWVEIGTPPADIIASKNKDDLKALIVPAEAKPLRTRPICVYPRVARWNGKGSTDAAENFTCLSEN
jgi:feruloyl esterase